MNMVAQTSQTLVMPTSWTRNNNLGSLGNAKLGQDILLLIQSYSKYLCGIASIALTVYSTINIDRSMR